MINAFLYLQLTTVRNALVQRLKRLKQPKYLFGALAGIAYFYFFFFRNVFRVSTRDHGPAAVTAGLPPDLVPFLAALGALVLLILVVLAWVVPSDRAALHFSEAEVAFLFPAPVTRRWLIHFKLLRSQFAILLTVFFLSLIFRRASFLGGNALTHAAGWWIILSTLNLHLIGASFVREQLLELGVNPLRRRLLIAGLLAGFGVLAWLWVRHTLPPFPSDATGWPEVRDYLRQILATAPLRLLLGLPGLVVAPFFAANTTAFFLALGPALLLMAAHYWWVMRAEVSFEEASIDQARKTAEVVAAVRAGDWRGGRGTPTKARAVPFRLAPTGAVAVAFLWKTLIALGPFYRVRNWLIFVALIVGFHVWAVTTHLDRAYYSLAAILPLAFGAWLLIAGPMFMRRDLRLLVTHFDLLRGYPLPGWQVVLGSLLPPIVILAAVEWLFLLLAAPSVSAAARSSTLAAGVFGTGALGIALVLPPLVGLMMSIPFAATLYFPAWAESSGTRGGGIEVMGQRMIFFAGYIIMLLVALVPAVLCGGLAGFIINWLAGTVAAVIITAVVAGLVLGAEFAGVVWWLGRRFESFDMSQEMPR